MDQTNHGQSLEPRILVHREEIDVDGRAYPLQPGDEVEVHQHSDWEVPAIGVIAGLVLLLLAGVLYLVGAPAFFFTVAAMGGAVLVTFSWLSSGHRRWMYELVLRHGDRRAVIAQSHSREPIYRARDEAHRLNNTH